MDSYKSIRFAKDILANDTRALAKAITLIESTRPEDREVANVLLDELLPHTGKALRLGISGAPGVGKSTFIEALGTHVTALGSRVAVLAIDPSSTVSGGSFLADKTRMGRLAGNTAAFVRPSPASGALGGVADRTREAMLICEAAGYAVVIVETVGVGQMETKVAGMTDLVVLLQVPNCGDELQARKKGVMDIADVIVINKIDTDSTAASRSEKQIREARENHVIKVDSLSSYGIDSFWRELCRIKEERLVSGAFEQRRHVQNVAWMWDIINGNLLRTFREHHAVRQCLQQTEKDVSNSRMTPSSAAMSLLELFVIPSASRTVRTPRSGTLHR